MCRCKDCWSHYKPILCFTMIAIFPFFAGKTTFGTGDVFFFFSVGTAMTPRGEKRYIMSKINFNHFEIYRLFGQK